MSTPRTDRRAHLARAVPSAANGTYYARRAIRCLARRTVARLIGAAEAERNRDLPTADLLAGFEDRSRSCARCWSAPASTRMCRRPRP